MAEKPIRRTTGKGGNYRKTKSGAGMTKKGVAAYRRANPGSKLKTAVTGKVKKGQKLQIDVSRTVQEAQANSNDHLQKHVTILILESDKHGEDGNVNMEPEQVLEQLIKRIKNRVNQLALSVTSGGVDNMETYKYIIGQINALESVRQEISNLQQDEGAKDENTGTVVDLKGRSPKIKEGLLDKYEKEPVKEVTKEATKLPQPTGWRMLVLPFRMKEKTDGGIIMGTETIDRQQVASQCGNVLAMGPDCYNDPKRFSDGPWCKVGDWVVFARYAGSRIEIEGGEVRLLNDDEILATVQDPTDILHKY